jgi:hypothetical protein
MQRQGDLLLIPTRQLPINLTPLSTRVVLAGDHSHQLDGGTVLRNPQGDLFIRVDEQVLLIHQEHAPLALAPGTYRVTRQRRYRPVLAPTSVWD